MKKLIIFILLCITVQAYAADSPTIQNVNSTTNKITNFGLPVVVYGDTITATKTITTSPCVIVAIYWQQPTTLTHIMRLQNKVGDTVFEADCVVVNQGLSLQNIRLSMDGIYMDDLDSGAVYFYLENN